MIIGIEREFVAASFRGPDDYAKQLLVVHVERLEAGGVGESRLLGHFTSDLFGSGLFRSGLVHSDLAATWMLYRARRGTAAEPVDSLPRIPGAEHCLQPTRL